MVELKMVRKAIVV
jgi:hypothetical protein